MNTKATKGKGRKKFEYMGTWVIGSNVTNVPYMESYLTGLGSHGWELCAGIYANANGNVFLYFKREAR